MSSGTPQPWHARPADPTHPAGAVLREALGQVPPLEDVLATARVVALPMRVPFRGITVREAVLFRGPVGWGEFAPFADYAAPDAAFWLASGIEAAWLGAPVGRRDRVEVNATVPAVAAQEVPAVLARFAGARTAKVKVAQAGQRLEDDLARVAAVRAAGIEHIRVDANGGWSVAEAVTALEALAAQGPLQYAEQPVRTVEELAQVRARTSARIAADESIRRAADPLAVVRAGAADVAVVKVAPLGGVRATAAIADQLADLGVAVVVSSALDTAVGMATGVAAATAVAELPYACGLGTGELFVADVAEYGPVGGTIIREAVVPDPQRLDALAARPETAERWIARLREAYAHV